jgi:hypothetical protein
MIALFRHSVYKESGRVQSQEELFIEILILSRIAVTVYEVKLQTLQKCFLCFTNAIDSLSVDTSSITLKIKKKY